MDLMMRLLLVWLYAACEGARALRVLGEYPYVFAAVPLHAPVPVVRVLTRAPAAPLPSASTRYAAVVAPLRHLAEPPLRQYGAGGAARPYAAEPEAEFETPQYSYARPAYYPPPRPDGEQAVLYARGQRGDASEEAAAVLYARLSPSGGYTYRRAHPHRRAPAKDEDPQYILKIHKYRIIKD